MARKSSTRFIAVILAIAVVMFAGAIAAFADETGGAYGPVSVTMRIDDPIMTVNGAACEVDPGRGTAPLILNDRTLIPIRALIEAFGGEVGWDENEQKITLDADGRRVEMWVDKTNIVVDGAAKQMDVAPVVINFRTMVPVRFAAENLGLSVGWDEATSTVSISSAPGGEAGTGGENAPIVDNAQKPATQGVPDMTDIPKACEFALKLPVDEPKGGRTISVDELSAILAPYYDKLDMGDGDSLYTYNINGDYKKAGGKWAMDSRFAATKTWDMINELFFKMYSESQIIFCDYDEDSVGKTECMLMIDDGDYSYMYNWEKGAKEGNMMKYKKEPSNDDSKAGYPTDAIIYDDQIINGQLCKVYSYVDIVPDNSSRTYLWLSTVTGIGIMSATYTDDGQTQFMFYTIDEKYVTVANSFFEPPASVHFSEY